MSVELTRVVAPILMVCSLTLACGAAAQQLSDERVVLQVRR